jgi:hypothetical protein
MLKRLDILSASFVALAACAVTISGAQAATVNVVHGINGRDLGATRALPVDIAVNGACALKGVTFTQSALVDLPPATYTITVHPADGNCGTSAVITQSVTIPDDGSRSFSAVASLAQNGTPQLAVFNNSKDIVIPPAVTTRHLAAAGPVFVTYRSPGLKPQTTRIRNGKFTTLGVLANRFSYSATISAGSKRNAIARLSGVARKQFSIFNIVGSKKSGFTIIAEKLNP